MWTEFTEHKTWLAGRVCVFVKIFRVLKRILHKLCKRDAVRICLYNICFIYVYMQVYKYFLYT